MRTHIQIRTGATVAGAILGATAMAATMGAWAQPAYAAVWRSPMLDPPAMIGDPPLMDPPVQQVPAAPVDGLLAQVQQLLNALAPPCTPPDVPPDQPDPTTADTASTTQACNVVVARNVGSPGAMAVASQSQEAPVTQSPSPTEAQAAG